jgi:hypothetical protein
VGNIEKLFSGDERLTTLLDSILEVVYERDKGLSFASVLGILDLVKDSLKHTQEESI